jgi:hypothetical protein
LSLIVNFYSLRRTLVEFYVKAAIYYAINGTSANQRLHKWLKKTKETNTFNSTSNTSDDWIDADPCFNANLDSDYDAQLKGVTLKRFAKVYFKWICVCKNERLKSLQTLQNKAQKRAKDDKEEEVGEEEEHLQMLKDNAYGSTLVKFCFLISLACRRALNTACCSNNNNTTNYNNSSMSQAIRNVINANRRNVNSGSGGAPLTMTSIGINNNNNSSSTSTNNNNSNAQANGNNLDY